jgi:hypothetical protein
VTDTGAIRDDLLIVMRRIAKHMNSRTGAALHACLADVRRHRELAAAIHTRVIAPRKQVILDVLERGVSRGDVRAEAVSDRVVELGPTLLLAERQRHGRPVRDVDVIAIVDEVLVPLVSQ